MNLWMMSEHELTELMKLQTIAMTATDEMARPATNCVAEYETHNEMRLFGPLIARSNRLTDYLGINSTEGYMAELDRLIDTGKKTALHIDGPGGQVSLLNEFADQIYGAGDQISAHVSGTAASAHMLLYLAAQGGRSAHYQATLGSMGVVAYLPYKSESEIVSRRANNKRPGKKIVQRRVDAIEQKYLENAAKYTGMSFDDVVKGSDQGAVFSGDDGEQRGFVDELTTYKSISERFAMSKTGDQNNNAGADASDKQFTQADLDSASETASTARDARWKKMLEHDNASANLGAVIHHATMPTTDDQALASLDFVAAAAPAGAPPADPPPAPAPAGQPPAASAGNEPPPPADDVAAARQKKADEDAAALAAVQKQRAAAGTNVPAGDDNGASSGNEPPPKEPTEQEKEAAQFEDGAAAFKMMESRR